MEQYTDEDEHSGEMQYPYIAKAFLDATSDNKNQNSSSSIKTTSTPKTQLSSLKVLSIMVGAISNSQQKYYGEMLSPFLARSNIFTVISTDFCHWGKRFGYTPEPASSLSFKEKSCDSTIEEGIHQYIERLDRMGMDHICTQQPVAFATYIKEWKNTICGRNPIGIYLNAIKTNKDSGLECLNLKFVKYAQSSQVRSSHESSVSYASAVARKS